MKGGLSVTETIRSVAITTYDNPYDPIDDFTRWFIFDEQAGYHTTSYLGRLIDDSGALSEEDALRETERAIDEMIRYDFQNVYKKVVRDREVEVIAS